MTIEFKRATVDSDYQPAIGWYNTILQESPTITATSEASGGEAENIATEATNEYWTPTSLPATVTFDFGSSTGAAYLGLASHNLFTSGCSITLQEYDGSSWNTVFTHTPSDDSIILFPFTSTSASQWRLTVDGVSEPSIGVMFLGFMRKFPSGILPAYTPMYMAENITLLTSQTITGQFMPNRIQRRGLSSSFSLNILDRSEVEDSNFQGMRRHINDGGTFFFASNPAELTEDVSYCWRQDGGEIKPTFEENGIFYKVQLSLEGFID